MINWFPLASKLYFHRSFRELSISNKVLFLELVSQFNYSFGRFYKPDEYFALKLGVNVKTVRRARQKLADIGFIKYKSGMLGERGKKLATEYMDVKYSVTDDCSHIEDYDCNKFAQIHRHSWNSMMQYFSSTDVWTWVTLWWWKQNHQTEDGVFFITKRDLQRFTGYGRADESIKRIHEEFEFNSGTKLFTYRDEFHRVVFEDWYWWADPAENEGNARGAVRIEEELEQKLQEKRKARETKGQRELLRFFRVHYKEEYGKSPQVSSRQKKLMDKLVNEHGIEYMKQLIRIYFASDLLPRPTGTNRKTLARFTELVENGSFERAEEDVG